MSELRHERLRRFCQAGVYPVTSATLSAPRGSLELVDAVLAGGARVVQLREKELSMRDRHALAVQLRHKTRQAGALLIIDDHVDLALAVGADGVHLGQQDLPLPAARELAPDLLLAASTHDAQEIEQAQQQGADLINIGPLYPTATKPQAQALGIPRLGELARLARVPFSVMGGISLDNLAPAIEAGASCVAVIRAIAAAHDPMAATQAFEQAVHSARAGRVP